MIGLTESFATGYLSSTFQDAIVFVILIAMMILRPSGLLRAGGGAEGLMDGADDDPDPAARAAQAAHRRRRVGRLARGPARAAARASSAGPRAARARPAARRSSPRSASPRRLVPLWTSNGYVIRVGFDTLLYMLLALGLNITVGYAGLLDLGYVAFYGFGAYVYAMLASRQVRPCTGRRRRSSRSS